MNSSTLQRFFSNANRELRNRVARCWVYRTHALRQFWERQARYELATATSEHCLYSSHEDYAFSEDPMEEASFLLAGLLQAEIYQLPLEWCPFVYKRLTAWLDRADCRAMADELLSQVCEAWRVYPNSMEEHGTVWETLQRMDEL